MKAQSTTTLYDYTKTMPVPRGSLFGVPDENFPKSDNKKHIRWDDENLRRNEMTKTARDIIDEPDTPWASPPSELFDSEEEEDDDDDEDNERRKKTLLHHHEEEIKARLERMEMSESGGTTTTTRRSTGVRFVAGERSSNDSQNVDDDDDDDDAILKRRLFEAQRKSLQCTYDRKKGTTFNKTAHPYARDDNREKYDDDDDDKDDKDEEEIKRELEALLNMQKSSS